MNGLKFPVPHNNKFYRYILGVTILSVSYLKSSAIRQFGELDLLKIKNQQNISNKSYTN